MSERDLKHPFCVAVDDELMVTIAAAAAEAGVTRGRLVRNWLRDAAQETTARETLERVKETLKWTT